MEGGREALRPNSFFFFTSATWITRGARGGHFGRAFYGEPRSDSKQSLSPLAGILLMQSTREPLVRPSPAAYTHRTHTDTSGPGGIRSLCVTA